MRIFPIGFSLAKRKSFTITPEHDLISKKTMMISPHITHFSPWIKILSNDDSGEEVIFDYRAPVGKTSRGTSGKPENASVPSRIQSASQEGIISREDSEIKILPESLPALAFQNDMDAEGSNNSRTIVPIISLVFIGACAYAAYFYPSKDCSPRLEVILKSWMNEISYPQNL